MAEHEMDDLEVEEEGDEAAFVEFDIAVSPSDPTLELLAQQIKRQDIIIPFYQRKFVWKIEQASRLIESFLMGLPVPQVFLYVNNEDQLEVIDGQQRLMSVKFFFDGYFGEEDEKGRRQVFKLVGLSERSDFNGKGFEDLSPRTQRKLRNTTLRAINIKQLKPSLRNDSVFHIFERLNTGGTQLKPQEIRNAVYRGDIVSRLEQLNKTPAWRNILAMARPERSQKDVELILRLLSLFNSWDRYEKPMLDYLNKKMNEEREFKSDNARRFADGFTRVTKIVEDSLFRPFRPRGVLNSAVLEAVLVTLLENNSISTEDLKSRYPKLFENERFLATITGRTTDTTVLKDRLRIAREVLGDVAA